MAIAFGVVIALVYTALLLAACRVIVPYLFHPLGAWYRVVYVGLLPTNPDGTFSRRDFLRSSTLAFGGFVVSIGLAAGTAWLMGDFSSNNPRAWIADGIMFGHVIFAMMCAGGGIEQLVHAIWWRPRRLACDWPNPEWELPTEDGVRAGESGHDATAIV